MNLNQDGSQPDRNHEGENPYFLENPNVFESLDNCWSHVIQSSTLPT